MASAARLGHGQYIGRSSSDFAAIVPHSYTSPVWALARVIHS
jgi:hypothetical protein